MLGILIICHRHMATYIKEATCGIVGEQEYFESIEVLPADGIEGTQDKIVKILANWQGINDILVFVDIFGGTPCNASAKFFRDFKAKNVDIISGVNLPIILTALSQRKTMNDLKDFSEKIIAESKKNIISLKGLNLI